MCKATLHLCMVNLYFIYKEKDHLEIRKAHFKIELEH